MGPSWLKTLILPPSHIQFHSVYYVIISSYESDFVTYSMEMEREFSVYSRMVDQNLFFAIGHINK